MGRLLSPSKRRIESSCETESKRDFKREGIMRRDITDQKKKKKKTKQNNCVSWKTLEKSKKEGHGDVPYKKGPLFDYFKIPSEGTKRLRVSSDKKQRTTSYRTFDIKVYKTGQKKNW